MRAPRIIPVFLALCACGPSDPEGEAFLGADSRPRRQTLERALWRPDLPYSRMLLGSYALGDEGWDLLPLLDESSSPFTAADARALAEGRPLDPPAPGVPGQDDGDPLALGRRTFFELPMRSDAYVEWLAARPELWDRIGLEQRADGSVRGLVRSNDVAGRVRVSITCAFCHARGDVPGFADRHLDLGLARALFAESQGAPEPRFRGWGPGRIDVTDDGVDAPTAIPDLWGASHERYLNASGVLAQEPHVASTMAVRFETQFIEGHNLERRPPRARVWALARFVSSLAAEPHDRDPSTDLGRQIFDRRCAGCHVPERGYAGGLVSADQLTSDPTVAHTPERGTGSYKVPSLVRIGERAPYLHDASQPTLESLLASGHPMGHAPPADEVLPLTEFLRRL